MKSFCLLFVTLFILAIPAIAQQYDHPTYYVNTGLAVPSTPTEFSDYWKTGFNIGGGVGFPISENASFIGNLLYSRFGFDGEKFMADNGFGGYGLEIDGGNANIITISGDFRFVLGSKPNKVTPYLTGGAGLFRISINEATMSYQGQSETVRSSTETKVGLNMGAGLNIALTPQTSLQLGVKYVLGFTKGENTGYFPLQIGLAFR
jgi:opacity protein-like surface antigen